jgi:hypothetical protein
MTPLRTTQPGREADHSPASSAEVKNGEPIGYLHSLTRPHDVMLNELRTGITLPLSNRITFYNATP